MLSVRRPLRLWSVGQLPLAVHRAALRDLALEERSASSAGGRLAAMGQITIPTRVSVVGIPLYQLSASRATGLRRHGSIVNGDFGGFDKEGIKG